MHTLLDPRDHVRYMAAKGLGQRQCREACTGLCRALRDGNEFVRRMAAWALGRIGDPAAIPVLQERMERESSSAVRKAMEESCHGLEKEARI
jgi:HEAT repeat protein